MFANHNERKNNSSCLNEKKMTQKKVTKTFLRKWQCDVSLQWLTYIFEMDANALYTRIRYNYITSQKCCLVQYGNKFTANAPSDDIVH